MSAACTQPKHSGASPKLLKPSFAVSTNFERMSRASCSTHGHVSQCPNAGFPIDRFVVTAKSRKSRWQRPLHGVCMHSSSSFSRPGELAAHASVSARPPRGDQDVIGSRGCRSSGYGFQKAGQEPHCIDFREWVGTMVDRHRE